MAHPLFTCESNFGLSHSAERSEHPDEQHFAGLDVTTPELGLTYQRPSTAALPISISNHCRNGGCSVDDAGTVLVHVFVEIADAADGSYAPMPRAEYTLQIGVFSDPSKASVASIGPEVSHEHAWHALAPGTRALVKVSPLERSINTGRFLRVRIDVRSFATPAAGAFFTEPRVILSRAGSEAAIHKILGDAHASEARAIGQAWVGALARPPLVPVDTLKGLAKALRAAATRATARKPGKRGGGSRHAASESDGDDDTPADSAASSPLAEGDGDEGSSTDGGSSLPAARGVAGRKRSAAEAATNFAPAVVRLRRAAAVAAVAALVSADAAPSPRETPPPPPTPGSDRGTLLPIDDDEMPAAAPHAPSASHAAVAAASSPTRLDYEASLSLSCMLEADEEAAAAGPLAGQTGTPRGGAAPLHFLRSPAVAPPAVHAPFPPAALALFRSLSQNLEVMCPAFSAGRAAPSVAPLLGFSNAGMLPAGGSPRLGGGRPWTQGTLHQHGSPELCTAGAAPACASRCAPAFAPLSGCASPIFSL